MYAPVYMLYLHSLPVSAVLNPEAEGQIRFQIQNMERYPRNPLPDCFRLQCLLRLTVVLISPPIMTHELELRMKRSHFVDHDGQTHAALMTSLLDEYHVDCGSVYL